MGKSKEIYSVWIGLRKSLVKTAVIAIPIVATVVLQSIPAGIQEMTVGGVLIYLTNMAVNYLKNRKLGK